MSPVSSLAFCHSLHGDGCPDVDVCADVCAPESPPKPLFLLLQSLPQAITWAFSSLLPDHYFTISICPDYFKKSTLVLLPRASAASPDFTSPVSLTNLLSIPLPRLIMKILNRDGQEPALQSLADFFWEFKINGLFHGALPPLFPLF